MSRFTESLAARGFRFNKRYGQNFITDINLLRGIVADSGIGTDDVVVEVGAGAGTLTRALAAAARKVYAWEIDENLAPILAETLSDVKDKAEVIFGDIMDVSDARLKALTGGDYHVVANLPYYITTPVIMKFLESEVKPRSITVTVQKEVAERLMSGGGDTGAVTLAVALEGDVQLKRSISRTLFIPAPNVDSAVIRIALDGRFADADKVAVKKLIRAAFAMRRKTLANNLCAVGYSRDKVDAALNVLNIDLRARGEELDVKQFIALEEELN